MLRPAGWWIPMRVVVREARTRYRNARVAHRHTQVEGGQERMGIEAAAWTARIAAVRAAAAPCTR